MELVITVVTVAMVQKQQTVINARPTPVRIIVAYACVICSGLDPIVQHLWVIVMPNVMDAMVRQLWTVTIV